MKFMSSLNEFDIGLDVVDDTWNGVDWVVKTPLYFEYKGDMICIPVGFKTDLGSIPNAFRCLLNRAGKSLRAFVVHDFLYSKGVKDELGQREVDEILYQLSVQDGESKWQAYLINKGLLVGGWMCYNKKEVRL